MKYAIFAIAAIGTIPLSLALSANRRWWKYIVWAMVLALALYGSTSINFFSNEDYRGTSRGMEVSVSYLFAAAILAASALRGSWPGLLPSSGAKFYALYFLLCLPSWSSAENTLFCWMETWKMMMMHLVYLAVLSFLKCTDDDRTVVRAFAFFTLANLAVVARQHFVVYQPHGLFPHQNSMVMALHVLGCVFFALYLAGGWKKARIEAVAFVAAGAALVRSYSRGALAVAPFAYGAAGAMMWLTSVRAGRFRIFLRTAPIIAAGIVGVSIMIPRLVERFVTAPEASKRTRVEFALCAAEMIKDEPFRGVGLNNWGIKINPPYPYAERAGREHNSGKDYRDGIVETVYLLVCAECGIPALAAMLLWFANYFILAFRLARRLAGTPRGAIAAGVFGGLAACYAQSILEWVLRQQINLVMLMVFFAMLDYFSAKSREEPKRKTAPAKSPPAVSPAAAAIALALLALPCAAAEKTRFLDPFTMLFQTDDPSAGAALSGEPGYWPVPNGLAEPAARNPEPRVIHSVYRISATPFPGYDPGAPSPLFKINQVGYAPGRPKFAYMGAWLGPNLGAWRPRGEMGRWRVVDSATGECAYESPDPPVHRLDDFEADGSPATGEYTYEMDFSPLAAEGVYHIEVPGVGRSDDFRIWKGAAEDAFRVHMSGLYHKRCGIAKTEPFTHWANGECHREATVGTFPPEEGRVPAGIRWFDVISQNTDWNGGKRIALSGGWHDAADYDRRPAHLTIVDALCAVYLMKKENFSDGQLAIPENANGIPDILDEAEWGLRHLKACQREDGGTGTWIETTGHPVPGSVAWRDGMRYAVSRPTRSSSLAYAARASLLARCHEAFRERYLESAEKAWDYAISGKESADTFFIEKKDRSGAVERRVFNWKENARLPSRDLFKAAVNLHALTGERKYLAELRFRRREVLEDFKKESWRWEALAFAGERSLGIPPDALLFMRHWDSRILEQAGKMLGQISGACAYRCPWWKPGTGWHAAMSWGNCHPLRRAETLVAAHAMTGDGRYLDAAFAALDFHNGCNPQGTTLTSGLGRVYPVAFLDLPSYADGIAEYVPGITPFRWNYAMPWRAVEKIWHGDKTLASKCPVWRRWGNLECLTPEASEYSVWETIAPAAAVCGYLLEPTGAPPPARPLPARDIRALPGYWPIP